MKYPIYIRFSGMEPSVALTAAAQAHAYGLTWAKSEIIACWVGIQLESEPQYSGTPYSVRVDVSIPGHKLTAQRVQNANVHLAIGHAFEDMTLQLQAIEPHINHAEYAVTVNGQLVTQPDSDKPGRQPH